MQNKKISARDIKPQRFRNKLTFITTCLISKTLSKLLKLLLFNIFITSLIVILLFFVAIRRRRKSLYLFQTFQRDTILRSLIYSLFRRMAMTILLHKGYFNWTAKNCWYNFAVALLAKLSWNRTVACWRNGSDDILVKQSSPCGSSWVLTRRNVTRRMVNPCSSLMIWRCPQRTTSKCV